MSTTYTFTSGDYLPRGSTSDYIEASSDEVRTIACSDFLTLPYVNPTVALSYQKSPICTSQIQWEHEHPDAPTGYGEGPPGLWNQRHVGDPFECCGGCYFQLPTISILYFTTTPTTQCSKSNATVTSFTSPSAVSGKLEKRAVPLLNATNNVIVDGSTLTYPSIYLVVEGAITVTDKCGVRGMIHTNPTIAIPPHGLTELSFWNGYQPAEGYKTLPYDPAVPANCRTYGFSNPQITSGWYQVNDNTSSVTTSTLFAPGYPYNPFLVPPQQLIDLDPAWKTCQYWSSFGNQYGRLTYGAFDPPRLLNSATAMVPQSTPAGPTTENLPSKTPDPAAQPGAKSSPEAPRVTSSAPKNADPADHSNLANPDPVASVVVSATDPTSQDRSAQAPLQSGLLVPAPSPSALGILPVHSSPILDPKPTETAAGNAQTEDHPGPSSQHLTSQDPAPAPTTVHLGLQVNAALTTIRLQSHANEQDALPTNEQIESHVNEQGAAPATSPLGSPTGGPPIGPGAPSPTIQFESHASEQGAGPATIQIESLTGGPQDNPELGGLIYSAVGQLGPAAGQSHAADPPTSHGSTVANPSIVTAAGQPLTVLDPSAVLIAGTTLIPGGGRLTVSGVPVSLASFGNLLVGNGPVSQTLPVLTIAGHTVTANPTSFNIAGFPIEAGGPSVTISGTTVNLDKSGNLVIGGSTPTNPAAEIQPSVSNVLAPSALPQSVFSIGGQYVTANPSAFPIAGTTISAGGPGITISGTPVSLDPSGSLNLGTNRIALAGSSNVPVDSSTDDSSLNAAAGTAAGIVSQQTGAASGDLALTAAGIRLSSSVGAERLTASGLGSSKDSSTSGSGRSTSTGGAAGGTSKAIPTSSAVSGTYAPTSYTGMSSSTGSVVSGADAPVQTSSRASGTHSPTPTGGSCKASGDVRLSGLIAMFIAVSMAIKLT